MDLPDLCPLHAITGLWCPLCGLTRGTFQLLTGHPLAALQYNALIVLVPLVAWAAVGERRIAPALATVLVAFAAVRNIPAADWLRGPA